MTLDGERDYEAWLDWEIESALEQLARDADNQRYTQDELIDNEEEYPREQ